MTSTTLTPQHPGPFSSHRRTSYYFSRRGWSLLQIFTPSRFLLIAWKSIFRKGVVLQLSTPNIISMDLVVSSSFLYLIRLTYDSHAVSMLLFSFHIIPHAHHTLFISVQCMAMLHFFSSILPPPCGCLMRYFLFISWPCLMHASTSCY